MGQERELFIRDFLSLVMPPGMRFGTGEVIDRNRNQSGQLDIVIEFPFSPSLGLTADGPRLYFSEGVGAVVEVKSDLSKHWDDVQKTARRLRAVKRTFPIPSISPYGLPDETIPLFVAGFKGWSDMELLIEKASQEELAGLLVVDPGLFTTGTPVRSAFQEGGTWYDSKMSCRDEVALLGFLFCVHRAMTCVVNNSHALIQYASSPEPRSLETIGFGHAEARDSGI
jgi:hypothetical protein